VLLSKRRELGAAPVRSVVLVATGMLLVLAALVLASKLLSRRSAPPPPEPKASVTLRRPRGEIGAPPREFAWAAVPGAVRYRVKISDQDALWPLSVRTTETTSLTLDAKEAASAITLKRIHVWEVEGLDAAGLPIARGEAPFWVTPSGPG